MCETEHAALPVESHQQEQLSGFSWVLRFASFNDEFYLRKRETRLTVIVCGCIFLPDDDSQRRHGAAASLPEGLDGGAFEGFGQNRVLGVNQF